MQSDSDPSSTGYPLRDVIRALEMLAPPALAASWDNTGLLLGNPEQPNVQRALLTIDLTEAVLTEAITLGVDILIAYHPPLFNPIKRLVAGDRPGGMLLELASQNIALYSPHTALDNVPGGVNDWLANAFPQGSVSGLHPHESVPDAFEGRLVTLRDPLPIEALANQLQRHLGLSGLRIARALGDSADRIAVCAGAGARVLADADVDVLVTGEMRHHDVLAAVASGKHVLLSEHTHTERGYLPLFAGQIKSQLEGLTVQISEIDQDPLSAWPHATP